MSRYMYIYVYVYINKIAQHDKKVRKELSQINSFPIVALLTLTKISANILKNGAF